MLRWGWVTWPHTGKAGWGHSLSPARRGFLLLPKTMDQPVASPPGLCFCLVSVPGTSLALSTPATCTYCAVDTCTAWRLHWLPFPAPCPLMPCFLQLPFVLPAWEAEVAWPTCAAHHAPQPHEWPRGHHPTPPQSALHSGVPSCCGRLREQPWKPGQWVGQTLPWHIPPSAAPCPQAHASLQSSIPSGHKSVGPYPISSQTLAWLLGSRLHHSGAPTAAHNPTRFWPW